ncbi:Verru_Chthon cassette protein A [Verrucomicrobium sp. BvORR034]|uniref:Verru_Chthon cassette protein A n=1 Tax=Verrucomicrobium sp. BvORR034 TaxID=1396418 RepID=UPI00067908A6|nr:Verru_Chthon cassette protein A [Verrucomicrobium sp. BvORR034]
MRLTHLNLHRLRRNKGVALILVISVLALLTILSVALFSVSETERSSSAAQYDQEHGRELGDTAVNVAMGQIWQGTKRKTNSGSGPTAFLWASQPGAIRRYNLDGTFNAGFRLYSSSQMIVTGSETAMIGDAPPPNWNTMPARYVDLNDPVIRPTPGIGTGAAVYFPIIDPRAYVGDSSAQSIRNIEGFSYGTRSLIAGAGGGSDIYGVKVAANMDDTTARLAMPVEWLYVLKDGTLGALNGSNEFVKPNGSVLALAEAAQNPIVGRVAFWTDDESCKININTASEPTVWNTPQVFHERDIWWAHYQPTTYEYQRYPGHPATVALSSVMFPNQDMDLYGKDPSSASFKAILRKKESIYNLAPKINFGGSKAGSEPYWKFVDNFKTYQSVMYEQYVSLAQSVKERLYASVDELYFSNDLVNKKRGLVSMLDDNGSATSQNLFSLPGEAASNDKVMLERARFFLTANSRMPETNMFGTPRIAIWPVADESKGAAFRTGFDQLIAFCSSMGQRTNTSTAKSYFFRRKNAYSPTEDIQIQRNAALLSYLMSLMHQKMPGGATFATKYPDDYKQILVEIFDYVRATNLYDGFLAPKKEDLQKAGGPYDLNNGTKFGNGPGEISADGQIYRNRPKNFKTFTYDRASASETRTGSDLGGAGTERQVERNFPGHGMVTPSQLEGGTYMGFGRFLTLSEVGFQFICTADGTTDKGSYRTLVPGTEPNTWVKGPVASGGRTAVRIIRHTGGGKGNGLPGEYDDSFLGKREKLFWYSNYPPRPTAATMRNFYGVDPNAGPDKPNSPYNHPGCQPANWNATLRSGAPPLAAGERQIQGMLVLKLTMPAAGFTEMNADFTLEIEGLGEMTLNGNELYGRSNNRMFWKSPQNVFDSTHCRPVGGAISSHAMTVNRRIGTQGQVGISADVGYDSSANSGGDPHRGTKNFDLTTRFVTVVPDGQDAMQFGGGPLIIKLYSGHLTTDENLVQTFSLTMPSRSIPVPQLVTLSSDHEQWQNSDGTVDWNEATDAPRWWALNFSGALNRFVGAWVGAAGGWNSVSLQNDLNTPLATRTKGRFFTNGGKDRTTAGNAPRGATTLWAYEPGGGNFNSGLINPTNPAQDSASDVHSDTKYSDTKPEDGAARDSRGADTLFTMVPVHGDTRLVAATKEVGPDMWVEHPRNNLLGLDKPGTNSSTSFRQYVAHNLNRFYSDTDAGYDRGDVRYRLIANAAYNGARIPDVPSSVQPTFVNNARRYGDFDNGIAGLRDGPYINKPDEGDAALTFHAYGNNNSQTVRLPNAYLATYDYGWLFSDPGESFMTPNRILPSPGMFGSLPTGVKSREPWKTLLFRPNLKPSTNATYGPGMANHPGAASWQKGVDPADHYFMDLFWMPIVEPYAISEPFSTAGKVNINYQIVPFTHIRRATGIHAVMKGEIIRAIPRDDAGNYLNMPGTTKDVTTTDNYMYRQPWTDVSTRQVPGANMKQWYRSIEVEKRAGTTVTGTLKQFESRFNFTEERDYTPPTAQAGLFRTASQVCEIYLMPKRTSATGDGNDATVSTDYTPQTVSDFWAIRRLTGDNTKEKPYTNIYGKITTQSNTFRVHYRAQVVRKARSVEANRFVPGQDAVLTDYRGSSLIERRIDPGNPDIPDYATSTSPTSLRPLDDFYRFRVLEVKRFMP